MLIDPACYAHDLQHVSLDRIHEVRGWTQSLGCTEAELRRAVVVVGCSADAVLAYVQRNRQLRSGT